MLLVLPFVVVIAADRASKAWVGATLWDPPRQVVLVPSWLELTPVANRGIAFGLLQETGGLLAIATIGVMGGAAVWKWREILASRALVRLSLGMIAGGALGNMLDRAQLGYVIDFIHVPPIWIFQVFNIADASIVVGTAVLTLVLGPLSVRRPRAEPATPGTPSD